MHTQPMQCDIRKQTFFYIISTIIFHTNTDFGVSEWLSLMAFLGIEFGEEKEKQTKLYQIYQINDYA